MRSRLLLASVLCILALAAPVFAQDLILNGSFESSLNGWTTNPSYPVSVKTSYNGVGPADGTKFLALAGPASVGYSYADVITENLSAPFGTNIPNDNLLVYLFASTYLHTNDGRNVSYAVTLTPGYGQAGSAFHQGPQDSWVAAQTWGYYIAHDPFDSSAPIKPITVSLELRDPLQQGEYLLLDGVHLYYGGPGIPEPSSLAAVILGMALLIPVARKWERTR